jgi:hypothetical protein
MRLGIKGVATLMFCFLTLGCSDQSDLAAARSRIVQLEAELAAERAKAPAQVVTPESVKPVEAAKVVAPEQKQELSGLQWLYEASEDKMTGGTTKHASVLSINTVSFDAPYAGAQHGQLLLRTHPKYGRDVIFSIERGQLLCPSYQDCEVLIRFDDGKPERFSAIGPADNSTETVFIRNYDRFLGKLRKAKVVRLSMNVYQEGAPVFEFDVSGFDPAKYAGKN